ncbi:MAG: biotin/lipoyl-binding protein, partial [Acidobacteria bacterium]|nr:biotin/lipoyl-binding protein [Acidobacteriota bacterium]
MKKNRILPTVLGIAVLAIALPLALLSEGEDTPVPERSQVRRVETAAVETATGSRSLRFPGTVRSETRARLAFQVSGRIARRSVAIGDSVDQGQELARLDDKELENALASARGALAQTEARWHQAQLEKKRVEALFAAGAATQ